MDLEKVLKQGIEELSVIGSDPEGGMARLPYADSWLATQKYVQSQTEVLELETQFDGIGNLFCRVTGIESPQETTLTGSHIDTVTNDGTLDGQYGIIASMIVTQYLLNKYGKPRHPLEALSMAEKEGSRFSTILRGNKNVVGEAKCEEIADVSDNRGRKFVDEMHRQDFSFRQEQTGHEDIEAFVEIHIEQGNILENERL